MANQTISSPANTSYHDEEALSEEESNLSAPPLWKTRRGWTICLAIVGIVLGGIFIWDTFKYRYIPKRFGTVIPGEIYRSGQISKWMFEPTIQKYGIDTVIDLNGIAKDDQHQQAEIASYETLNLNHHRHILAGNGTGMVENYVDALETMAKAHRNGETILVHCAAGAQRTGSVTAAYRVLVLGDPPQKAYEELQQYGWDPDSDQVLLQYLNGNMQFVAESLVERGVIERVPDPLPVVGP